MHGSGSCGEPPPPVWGDSATSPCGFYRVGRRGTTRSRSPVEAQHTPWAPHVTPHLAARPRHAPARASRRRAGAEPDPSPSRPDRPGDRGLHAGRRPGGVFGPAQHQGGIGPVNVNGTDAWRVYDVVVAASNVTNFSSYEWVVGPYSGANATQTNAKNPPTWIRRQRRTRARPARRARAGRSTTRPSPSARTLKP